MNTYDPQMSYWHGCALLENICGSRQLLWSGAKVRLLVDFEVITPLSWPLSQRDQTYGSPSVRTGKVFSTMHSCRFSTGFIVDLQNYWFISFPFSLMDGCFSTYSVEISPRPPAGTNTEGSSWKKNLTPIIHFSGRPRVQTNVKQTRGPEGRRVVTGSCVGGGRKASAAAAESLSLLPADLVPAFCHRDPPLLGPVIRPWRHNRKSKQSSHQLHQEPWPGTQHSSRSSLLSPALPANIIPVVNPHQIWEATNSRLW